MQSLRKICVYGGCIILSVGAGGCAQPYMPLGDYQVMLRVEMEKKTIPGPGAHAAICEGDPNTSNPLDCGKRKVNEDLYWPDEIAGESALGIVFPLKFHPYGDETETIQKGIYGTGIDTYPSEGQRVCITINDLPDSEVIMPPFLQVTKPNLNESMSRKAGQPLHIEYEPAGLSFPIVWTRIRLYNGLGSDPCDALEWPVLEGKLEADGGSIDIPMDAFPANLPPEGCNVAVVVRRHSEGTLGEGITGYLRGHAQDGAMIRLMP